MTSHVRGAHCVRQTAAQRGILSQHNGDKSRFNRQRKQKALQRKRNRELRKALGVLKTPTVNAGSRAVNAGRLASGGVVAAQ